jgi:hypothetical protein
MKNLFWALLLLPLSTTAGAEKNVALKFDVHAAERFARLALGCVEKEYPNKISHVLNGDADVAPPRKLTPAFYGCYDWHSSVHGHWLLVRLVRTFPDASFATSARDALRKSLTAENLNQLIFAERVARVSNVHMDWRGYSNYAPSCVSGTTTKRGRCRRTCTRLKKLQSSD